MTHAVFGRKLQEHRDSISQLEAFDHVAFLQ